MKLKVNYLLYVRHVSHSVKKYGHIITTFTTFKRFKSFGNEHFQEHEICIKTCGNLYRRWREEKKFSHLPNGDLEFRVKYIDINQNPVLKARNSMPLVVAIHGAPGSYRDFSGLAFHLQQKARIIVPNFPGNYKPGIFRFTPEEKAQFLKDFLAAISVSQIDASIVRNSGIYPRLQLCLDNNLVIKSLIMLCPGKIDALVVHSSGIYPGLQLCLDNNLVIKSLIMLCPGTYSYDMKATKHIKCMRMLVALSEKPLFLKVFQPLTPIILKLAKIPVRVENIWDPLLSMTCVVNGDVPQAKEKFHTLAQRGFPMLYAFSKDDKLIGKEMSYNLAYLLGASDADIHTYDKDGNITNKGKENSPLKVMVFESGSHYVFWKHPDIIYKAIEEFMEKL